MQISLIQQKMIRKYSLLKPLVYSNNIIFRIFSGIGHVYFLILTDKESP